MKIWKTRRITLDFDWPYHFRPPLDALRAVYNLHSTGILEKYRIDATKKGCHVVLWLTEDLTFVESLRLREMLGDDGIRAGLDAFRPPYAAGVLWSRKKEVLARKGSVRSASLL